MVEMFNSKNSPEKPLMGEMNSSLEFQVISPPASNENGNFTHLNNLHLSLSAAACDLSPEVIQSHLRELLKENIQLKEILHQNNVVMTEQFRRLLEWQQEMMKIQNEHKERFEEARLLIHKIRQENDALKNQKQDPQSSQMVCEGCKILEEANRNLKDQLNSVVSEVNQLKKETEQMSIIDLQLKSELSTLASANDELKNKTHHLIKEKQELIAMNNELNAKLAICRSISPVQNCQDVEENKSFIIVPTLDNFSEKEFTIKQDKPGIKGLLLQLHMERDKVIDLNKKLEDERETMNILNKQIEELRQRLDTPYGTDLLRELKESGKKFNIADTYLERYMERCDSLKCSLLTYQDQLDKMSPSDNILVDKLRDEIINLRKALTEQQSTNLEDRKHLLDAQRQFESLLKDYQALLKSWESYKEEQMNKDKQSEAYYEIQTKILNEQIDNLTAKLVCNEEALESKADEVKSLKHQMQNSLQGTERIEFLEAQVEIYRTDFRAETEQRQRFQTENENLNAENQALRLHNKQLQEQLQNCQRLCLDEGILQQTSGRKRVLRFDQDRRMKSSGDAGPSDWQFPSAGYSQTEVRTPERTIGNNRLNVPEVSPSSFDDNIYLCPKCNLGFTEFQPLENHVNGCLDKDDPFL